MGFSTQVANPTCQSPSECVGNKLGKIADHTIFAIQQKAILDGNMIADDDKTSRIDKKRNCYTIELANIFWERKGWWSSFVVLNFRIVICSFHFVPHLNISYR